MTKHIRTRSTGRQTMDGEAGGGTKEHGSPPVSSLRPNLDEYLAPFRPLEYPTVFKGLSETACQGEKCTVYDLLKAIGKNGISALREKGIKINPIPPRDTVKSSTRNYALRVATKIGAASTSQQRYEILKSVEVDLQNIEIPFDIMFYTEFNEREKALAAAAAVIEEYVRRNANIEKNGKSQNTLNNVFVDSGSPPEDTQGKLEWCLEMGEKLLDAVPHDGDKQRNKDPKFLNYQRLASLVPLLRILEIQESILGKEYSRYKSGPNPVPGYYDKQGRLLAYWYNFFANVMGSEAAPEQLDHNGAAGSGTDEDIDKVLEGLPSADHLDGGSSPVLPRSHDLEAQLMSSSEEDDSDDDAEAAGKRLASSTMGGPDPKIHRVGLFELGTTAKDGQGWMN